MMLYGAIATRIKRNSLKLDDGVKGRKPHGTSALLSLHTSMRRTLIIEVAASS